MSGVNDYDPPFFRVNRAPVRAFAGDERIHAEFGRFPYRLHTCAGARADRPAMCAPADVYRARERVATLSASKAAQSLEQLRRRKVAVSADATVNRFVTRETDGRLEPDFPREKAGVAESLVRIERQVRRIQRNIVVEKQAHARVERAREWLESAPEEPLMHEQEGCTGINRS